MHSIVVVVKIMSVKSAFRNLVLNHKTEQFSCKFSAVESEQTIMVMRLASLLIKFGGEIRDRKSVSCVERFPFFCRFCS